MLCLFKSCFPIGFCELLTSWSPGTSPKGDLHAETAAPKNPILVTFRWTNIYQWNMNHSKMYFRQTIGDFPMLCWFAWVYHDFSVRFEEFLQEACARYINSEMSGLPQIKGKMVRSLCSRLKGKEGRYFARTKHVSDVGGQKSYKTQDIKGFFWLTNKVILS